MLILTLPISITQTEPASTPHGKLTENPQVVAVPLKQHQNPQADCVGKVLSYWTTLPLGCTVTNTFIYSSNTNSCSQFDLNFLGGICHHSFPIHLGTDPTAPPSTAVAPFFRPSKTLFLMISQFPYPPSMAIMGFISFKGSSKDFGMSITKLNQERSLLHTATSCRKLQIDSFRILLRKKMGKTWLLKAAGLGNPAKAAGLGNPDGQSLGQVNREVKAQEVPTGRRKEGRQLQLKSGTDKVPLSLRGIPSKSFPGSPGGVHILQSFSGKFSVMRWSSCRRTTMFTSNSGRGREKTGREFHRELNPSSNPTPIP